MPEILRVTAAEAWLGMSRLNELDDFFLPIRETNFFN